MAEKRLQCEIKGAGDKVNKNMGLSDGLHFPTMKGLGDKKAGDEKEPEEEGKKE